MLISEEGGEYSDYSALYAAWTSSVFSICAKEQQRAILFCNWKERQTTILNTGVMVQGGDVKAESLAVGAGSQAVNIVKKAFSAKAGAKGAGG